MLGLLGKKVGMTQVFDEEGRQVPVTVLEVGPCYVTALRTEEKDGYKAVQLGFDTIKEKKLTKPKIGHLRKAKVKPLRFLHEIRSNSDGLEVGAELNVDNFSEVGFVDVSGVSIGRGFQGVVKRHNFSGGEKAHGTKFGREPGSTGMSAYPSRVIKGMKFPGQMGNKKVTSRYLKVIKVDLENNLLVVKGNVPGVEGKYLVIKTALKEKKEHSWKVKNGKQQSAEKSPEEASVKPPVQESSDK